MNKKHLPLLALAFLFFLFIGFGLVHLGKFHTADEDLWFANPTTGRVHTYWSAILSGNWEGTYINDKPGITAAIISGSIGLFFDTNPQAKVLVKGSSYRISDPVVNERTSFYFRLPILLTNALLILSLFFLTQKYTQNTRLSLLFAFFLFLSPILLGISQIVNPDSALWSLTFISFLSFLIFLRYKKWSFFAVSIVASGFALLSKYTTIFLFVLLLFIFLSYIFFFLKKESKNLFQEEMKRLTIFYPLFLLGTFIIFMLGMPASILHPELLYSGTIGFQNSKNIFLLSALFFSFFAFIYIDTYVFKNWIFWKLSRMLHKVYPWVFLSISVLFLGLFLFTTVNWTFNNFAHLPEIPFDQARGEKFQNLSLIKKYVFEIRPLVFTLTPITLFFALFELFLCTLQFRKKAFSFLHFSLLSFLFLFYIAVISQGLLVDNRYGIILYPVLLLLSVLGAVSFFNLLLQRISPAHHRAGLVIFMGIIFLSSTISLWSSKPFYFNYTNSLLPKKNSITTAWGYGGYEAAQYLNTLPNARDLVAWTDYEGFCNFFLGKCIKGSGINHYKKEIPREIDYYIVTRRGRQIQKNNWTSIKKSGAINPTPIWTLPILDRKNNSIEIYEKQSSGNIVTNEISSPEHTD